MTNPATSLYPFADTNSIRGVIQTPQFIDFYKKRFIEELDYYGWKHRVVVEDLFTEVARSTAHSINLSIALYYSLEKDNYSTQPGPRKLLNAKHNIDTLILKSNPDVASVLQPVVESLCGSTVKQLLIEEGINPRVEHDGKMKITEYVRHMIDDVLHPDPLPREITSPPPEEKPMTREGAPWDLKK